MKTKLSTYVFATVLALFSSTVFSFQVTPSNVAGDEGSLQSLTLSVDSSDWIYIDGSSNYCSTTYHFLVDLSAGTSNATWSDDEVSGDFNLDQSGSPVAQGSTLAFCDEDGVAAAYGGYSLNLHADDVADEGTETAQIIFTGQCNDGNNLEFPCPSNVSLSINDTTPVYEVTISGTSGSEPDIDGSFTVTLNQPAGPNGLEIYFSVALSSTATANEDYESLGSSVVIAPGATSADIPVVVIDDGFIEGTETVVVDLVDEGYNLGSPSSASVDIADDDGNPVASIKSSRAAEPGPPDGNDGMFTIILDQSAPSGGLTINYTVSAASTATSGVDYEALSGSVDIPAGSYSVEIPVVVIDDNLREGSESVIVNLVSGSGYNLDSNPSSTMFIIDDDNSSTLTVGVSASNASEPSGNGKFTFSLSNPAPAGGVTVNYVVLESSTASNGADYQSSPSSINAFPTAVNFAAGSSSAEVPIMVIDDDIAEGPETIIIQIQDSADYDPGVPDSATLTIMDDDSAGLQVSSNSVTVSEAGSSDQFTVALSAEPSADVSISVSSSNPAEGIVEPSSLLFDSANWSSPQTVTVTGVDDNVIDGDIDFNVTLTTSSSDSEFAALAPVQIAATNQDNDEEPSVSFPQLSISVTEDVGSAQVTVERLGASDSELTVNFSTDDNNSGTTATPGTDYTPVNEVLVWAANDNSPKTVLIPIVNDTSNEGDETIVLKLQVVGSGSPIYADLVVSNDFVEDVIALIDPDSLPPNQRSITEVILTACPTGLGQGGFQELCTDLVVEALEGGSVRNPLIQVTPDEAGAARTPATQTQTVQNINVTGRQSALRGGAVGLSMQGFSVNMAGFNMNTNMFQSFGSGYDSIQANATNPMATNFMANNLNASGDDADDFGKWGVWVSGKAVFGDKDATANEQGFDFDTAGLTIGVDYRFTDKFVAGAAFGYANNSIKQDAKSGKLDTTGFTGTIYGSFYPSANFYMDASISFGNNDYKQVRNVSYVLSQIGETVDESFKVDYSGNQTGITFGTGYDFNKDGWVFGPTLFVEYIDISVDAYDEKLASSNNSSFTLGWATHINKQSYESLIPSIGGQISKAFSQSWGVIVPQAHVSWAKELRADGDIISGYFRGDTGQVPFSLLTDDLDDDFFKAGIGLSAMFQNNKSAFLSIDGDFGRDLLTVYYINAGFRWEF